jgi:hypothetical protein
MDKVGDNLDKLLEELKGLVEVLTGPHDDHDDDD